MKEIEGLAIEALHHDEKEPFLLSEAIGCDDVGMIEHRREARFLLEQLVKEGGIVLLVWVDDLEHHTLVLSHYTRVPYFCLASLPDDVLKAILLSDHPACCETHLPPLLHRRSLPVYVLQT